MSENVPGDARAAHGEERGQGEETKRLDEPAAAPGAADGRMADLLASGRSSGELRKQLEQAATPEDEDLLSRLNALDFVNGIVGDAPDMPEREERPTQPPARWGKVGAA